MRKLLASLTLSIFFAAPSYAGTFTFVITYPDAQQTRITNALRANYTTTDANGNPVVPTTPQAIEKLRLSVSSSIKDLVLRVERDTATNAAAAGVTPVDTN